MKIVVASRKLGVDRVGEKSLTAFRSRSSVRTTRFSDKKITVTFVWQTEISDPRAQDAIHNCDCYSQHRISVSVLTIISASILDDCSAGSPRTCDQRCLSGVLTKSQSETSSCPILSY